MKRLAVLLLPLALVGCFSRELFLTKSEVDWESQGIRRLAVPAFEAQPNAWTLADEARSQLVEALGRGTVEVASEKGQAILQGALSRYNEEARAAMPRRVQKSTAAAGLPYYAWEMDVTQEVRLSISLRLLDGKGQVLWSRESFGEESETLSMPLNWPGSDPVAPPAILPKAPDEAVYQRLRQSALREALRGLINALTVHYEYRILE